MEPKLLDELARSVRALSEPQTSTEYLEACRAYRDVRVRVYEALTATPHHVYHGLAKAWASDPEPEFVTEVLLPFIEVMEHERD